jgi:hypothetical protein
VHYTESSNNKVYLALVFVKENPEIVLILAPDTQTGYAIAQGRGEVWDFWSLWDSLMILKQAEQSGELLGSIEGSLVM